MRKLREVIGYFNRSTQANTKLLKFQAGSDIEEYQNSRPKKLIQDVVTRWWSTYQSIERALYLQKAIKGLLATNQVDCEELSSTEWSMLQEIETVLKPLAFFQRVLEGEAYVTGLLLVPLTVYNIRRQLNDIAKNQGTSDGVRALAKVLLSDFDARFTPNPLDDTKLSFSWGVVLGFRKRYTTVHHYFFAAAFLDPRAKTLLKTFMTAEDWNLLKTNIHNLMVAGEEAGIESTAEKVVQPTSSAIAPTTLVVRTMSAKAANVSLMFGVHAVQMQTKSTQNNKAADPKSVRNRCAQNLMLLSMMEYGSH